MRLPGATLANPPLSGLPVTRTGAQFTPLFWGNPEAKDRKIKILWRFAGAIQFTGSESGV